MGNIDWMPIFDAGLRVKNSAERLLLWVDGEAVIGFWQDCEPNAGNWVDDDDEILTPSHFAEINGPS